MTQLSLGGLGGIMLAPDVLEEQRGAWCSPPEWCERATERAPFDVDPFTNPRSALKAHLQCMIERGDDGFGLHNRNVPGAFYVNPEHCRYFKLHAEVAMNFSGAAIDCDECGHHVADEKTSVWVQPPYDIVIEALEHYGYTRFVALLRLDTSTVWFQLMYAGITEADLRNPELLAKLTKALKHTRTRIMTCPPLCEVVMVPKSDRLEFVPPPGVKASSNPYPHGLYYRRAEDVTDAVREHCYPWPTTIYPWDVDPLKLRPTLSARWRLFEHKIVLG